MNDDIERGCLLPAAHAFITGVLVCLLALAVCQLQGWSLWLALAAGAAGAVMMWLSSVSTWRRVTFGPDPVQWSEPTPVTPDPVQVVVSYDEDGAHHTQLQDLPVDYDRMKTLAGGLLSGTTFSESVWCGQGRPFSKSEFHQLRRAFLSRGWMQWRNPNAPAQGVQLSRPGVAVMKTFSSDTTYPGRR